jgi:hypothetical protein
MIHTSHTLSPLSLSLLVVRVLDEPVHIVVVVIVPPIYASYEYICVYALRLCLLLWYIMLHVVCVCVCVCVCMCVCVCHLPISTLSPLVVVAISHLQIGLLVRPATLRLGDRGGA